MQLILDMGNSTIVATIMTATGEVVDHTRIHTEKQESQAFYETALCPFLTAKDYSISKAALSSVVPELNATVSQAVTALIGIPVAIISSEMIQRIINIDVDAPASVGYDRLCDCIGALTIYPAPLIVIDMGTATTINVIDHRGSFIGGMIIPGVKTSHRALAQRASQLPEVPIEAPGTIIGRNTIHCLQSGIVYGYAAMIDGIISRISAEAPQPSPFHIVATGGMAPIITPHCSHAIHHDKFLLERGIHCIVNDRAYNS